MKVMYRRWKSHTQYSIKRKRIDTFIILILIFSICGLFIRYFEFRVFPVVLKMAEDQAETTVVVLIDKTISQCPELYDIDYDDIVHITYDENNEPKSISAHTVKLNKIRADLSVEMNRKLDGIAKTSVFIPVGTLLGFKMLSGIGFRVPVEFVPYGTAYAEFSSSFEGHDINRTMHRIYLTASASISILVPFKSQAMTVRTDIPIAETIISGEVPESLINIDGLVKHEKQND